MRRSRGPGPAARTARSRSAPPAWRSAIGAGIVLDDVQPTLDTAPLSEVPGAAALAEQPTPQQTRRRRCARTRWKRSDDRSRAFYDGCLVGIEGTNSNNCLYGDPHGDRTLILFGDSHAMQYFPALEELAEAHDWRLIALTKAECPPGEVEGPQQVDDREYSQCDDWRKNSLERIEEADTGPTVVMSGDTEYTPYGPRTAKS